MVLYTWYYHSPLGGITLGSDGTALAGLWFNGQKRYGNPFPALTSAAVSCQFETRLPVFGETCRWLDSYFRGEIPDFTPPLALHGSDFRQAVWKILLEIPCGQTVTYGWIAGRLAAAHGGGRMSAQAVGGAVGHNPVSLIVPCHRVVGAGGNLTGYAGGLDRKTWLLAHEKTILSSAPLRGRCGQRGASARGRRQKPS